MLQEETPAIFCYWVVDNAAQVCISWGDGDRDARKKVCTNLRGVPLIRRHGRSSLRRRLVMLYVGGKFACVPPKFVPLPHHPPVPPAPVLPSALSWLTLIDCSAGIIYRYTTTALQIPTPLRLSFWTHSMEKGLLSSNALPLLVNWPLVSLISCVRVGCYCSLCAWFSFP